MLTFVAPNTHKDNVLVCLFALHIHYYSIHYYGIHIYNYSWQAKCTSVDLCLGLVEVVCQGQQRK